MASGHVAYTCVDSWCTKSYAEVILQVRAVTMVRLRSVVPTRHLRRRKRRGGPTLGPLLHKWFSGAQSGAPRSGTFVGLDVTHRTLALP